MLKKICLILFSSSILMASVVSSGKSKITEVYAYPSNESVLFKIENPITECTGYFFSKSDIGFEANLSMALSAYHSKNSLIVYGKTEILFSGSGNKYCKIHAIQFL